MEYLLWSRDAEKMDAQDEPAHPSPVMPPRRASLAGRPPGSDWITAISSYRRAARAPCGVREGAIVVDGPFAETREAVGGLRPRRTRHVEEAVRSQRRIRGARAGDDRGRPLWGS